MQSYILQTLKIKRKNKTLWMRIKALDQLQRARLYCTRKHTTPPCQCLETTENCFSTMTHVYCGHLETLLCFVLIPGLKLMKQPGTIKSKTLLVSTVKGKKHSKLCIWFLNLLFRSNTSTLILLAKVSHMVMPNFEECAQKKSRNIRKQD